MIVPGPTRFLTALAIAGALGIALQADSAGGAPKDEQASSPAPKGKAAAPKEKAAAPKDKAAAPRTRPPRRRPRRQRQQGRAARPASKSSTAKASTTGTIPRPKPPEAPLAVAATASTPSPDIAAVKEAIAQARKGEPSRATRAAEHDQRSGRTQAGRMGDPAQRRQRGRLRPLCRLHHRQSELAEHRLPAPPRRGGALAGPPRSRDRARAISARTGPLTSKGKFALARALLLQGDRAGAQSLVREAWRNENFSGELEGQVLDVFRGPDHERRPQGAHGHAPLRGRRRRRHALGQSRRRQRARDRQGPHRGDQEGGATPRRCSTRCRQKRAATSATSSAASQLLRRADKVAEAAELILSVPHDPAQAIDTDQWWIERRLVVPQAARPRRCQDGLSGRARRRRAQPGQLSRRAPVHRRLDRAALPQRSDHRARPFRQGRPGHQQPDHARARRLLAGPRRRGARPATARRARITRRRRAIRPPITARLPAPGSVTRTSWCGRRRSRPRIGATSPGSKSCARSRSSTPSTSVT